MPIELKVATDGDVTCETVVRLEQVKSQPAITGDAPPVRPDFIPRSPARKWTRPKGEISM
jgi:hypothetical protein